MAFKKLTEEQLELLTEVQRQRYLQELSLYEQREAFVRSMEAYENVELPAVKPTLRPIRMAEPMEVSGFVLPDHTVAVPQAVAVTERRELPELPDTQAFIREVPVVPVPTAEPAIFEFENTQPDIPKLTVPAAQEYKYDSPAAKAVSLPQVAVMNPAELKYQAAELSEVSVPQVAAVNPADPKYQTTEVPEITVPQVAAVPTPEGVAFQAAQAIRDIAPKAVPAVKLPAPETALSAMPAPRQVEMPAVSPVTAPEKTFVMPELASLELPGTALPQQPKAPSFAMPTPGRIKVPEAPRMPNIPEAVPMEKPTISELPRVREVALPELPTLSSGKVSLWEDFPAVWIPEADAGTLPDMTEAPVVTAVAPTVSAPELRPIRMPETPKVSVPRVMVEAPEIGREQVSEFLERLRRKE